MVDGPRDGAAGTLPKPTRLALPSSDMRSSNPPTLRFARSSSHGVDPGLAAEVAAYRIHLGAVVRIHARHVLVAVGIGYVVLVAHLGRRAAAEELSVALAVPTVLILSRRDRLAIVVEVGRGKTARRIRRVEEVGREAGGGRGGLRGVGAVLDPRSGVHGCQRRRTSRPGG